LDPGHPLSRPERNTLPVAVDADGKTDASYKVNRYPDDDIIDRGGSLAVTDCADSKVDPVLEKLIERDKAL